MTASRSGVTVEQPHLVQRKEIFVALPTSRLFADLGWRPREEINYAATLKLFGPICSGTVARKENSAMRTGEKKGWPPSSAATSGARCLGSSPSPCLLHMKDQEGETGPTPRCGGLRPVSVHWTPTGMQDTHDTFQTSCLSLTGPDRLFQKRCYVSLPSSKEQTLARSSLFTSAAQFLQTEGPQ